MKQSGFSPKARWDRNLPAGRDTELSKGYGQFAHILPVATEDDMQRMNCANTEDKFSLDFAFSRVNYSSKKIIITRERRGAR